MGDLKIYTPTELLKLINDIKNKHEARKKELVEITIEIDKLDKVADSVIDEIHKLERKYVLLIEELNKR